MIQAKYSQNGKRRSETAGNGKKREKCDEESRETREDNANDQVAANSV